MCNLDRSSWSDKKWTISLSCAGHTFHLDSGKVIFHTIFLCAILFYKIFSCLKNLLLLLDHTSLVVLFACTWEWLSMVLLVFVQAFWSPSLAVFILIYSVLVHVSCAYLFHETFLLLIYCNF